MYFKGFTNFLECSHFLSCQLMKFISPYVTQCLRYANHTNPFSVDQKILSVRKEPMLSGFLTPFQPHNIQIHYFQLEARCSWHLE